jgi:hypothetical protein
MLRYRRRQPMRIAVLAGWLFADLFLVLFMVALASVPASSLAVKSPSSKPMGLTHPARPKPAKHSKPAKSATPGMTNIPTDICVSQESPSIVADFDAQVKRAGMAGRKVGFILVFATGTDPSAADTIATAALKSIKGTDPDRAAFADTGGEGLWGGESDSCPVNGGTDNYHFQVFFYE